MSNVFGVPPPPAPQIFEPRPGSATPAYAPQEAWYDPDPHPARRRFALLLAFLAVGLLVFANLATWLHLHGVRPDQAPLVATATYDTAAGLVRPELEVALTTAAQESVKAPAGTVPIIGTSVDVRTRTAVTKAVNTALASPDVRAAWASGVAQALAQQQKLLDGDVTSGAVAVQLSPAPIQSAMLASMTQSGFDITTKDLTVPAYTVAVDASTGGATRTLGNLQDLWWLLWAGAIALGAASIAVATRRLRLATILAIDATAMLAVCLILVPLMRGVAEDQATDQSQVPLVNIAYVTLTKSLTHQTLVLMGFSAAAAVVLGLISRAHGRRRAVLPAA